MDNRYDMASSSAASSSSYFGINRFVEETKRNEEIITENNDENLELIPGTYLTDKVIKSIYQALHIICIFMFQYFEESEAKTGPDSLKSFIAKNFDQIEKERKSKERKGKERKSKERKSKETPKKKKDKDEDEEKKETKKTSKRKLVRFISMLLQYVAAFIQKSRLDFSQFRPSSTLGQHLLYHLQHTSTTTKMMSTIDEREDEKGHMILVR